MVVAASLLTTGFVLAAAVLLWRQYDQHTQALAGLQTATQGRDEARLKLQEELDGVRTWAATVLENLPAQQEQQPGRTLARRHAGTVVPAHTWTEPPLFDLTALDDAGARRSAYTERLIKVYGGGGDHVTTLCLGIGTGRWRTRRPVAECTTDPFVIYAVGMWPVHKVAEAVSAAHDRYADCWYSPSEPFAAPDVGVYPYTGAPTAARSA